MSRRGASWMLPQKFGLLDELSVRENITYQGRLADELQSARGRVDALAGELDLTETLSRLPTQTSVGQQQRTGLARADHGADGPARRRANGTPGRRLGRAHRQGDAGVGGGRDGLRDRDPQPRARSRVRPHPRDGGRRAKGRVIGGSHDPSTPERQGSRLSSSQLPAHRSRRTCGSQYGPSRCRSSRSAAPPDGSEGSSWVHRDVSHP